MTATVLPDRFESRRLRLSTLIRLRWLAILGQTMAVVAVAYGLEYPMPVSLCLALIALSAWLNLFLTLRFPVTVRLHPAAAFGLLVFDVLQLLGLLFLTGGLSGCHLRNIAAPADDAVVVRPCCCLCIAARFLPFAIAVDCRSLTRHSTRVARRFLHGNSC